MTASPVYPPIVLDSDFAAVDTVNKTDIQNHFGAFIRNLHAFLNQVPCLRELQKTRRKWKRTTETDAFGTFATDPEHWYTFNHGGRNEAQLNFGFHPTHVRIGLGFEFSLRKGGDPTAVWLAYTCFVNVIRKDLDGFRRFVERNSLEGEWYGGQPSSFQIIPTEHVVDWLLNLPPEPSWVFVGRLLRRGTDAQVLQDQERLAEIIQDVFCGLRPIWEQTQIIAASC